MADDTPDVEGPPEGGITTDVGGEATTEGAPPGTVPTPATATLEGGPPTEAEGLSQPDQASRNFMELPSWLGGAQGPLGQILGGMMGHPGNTVPPGATVTQRHGGFMTGLAGVLLEGLASGMAPNAAMASQMPIIMQQQRLQAENLRIQNMKMQQEMQLEPLKTKVELAKMQIEFRKTDHAMMDLDAEDQMSMSDAQGTLVKQSIANGDATEISRGSPDAIMSQWHDIQASGQNDSMQVYPWYTKMDPNTHKVTQMGLYKIPNPNALSKGPLHTEFKLGDETYPIDVPGGDGYTTIGDQHKLAQEVFSKAMTAKFSASAVKAAGASVNAVMPDGTNVVMTKEDADKQHLYSYPIKDTGAITRFNGRMNDAQQAMNALARIDYSKVETAKAAVLLNQDHPEFFKIPLLSPAMWAEIKGVTLEHTSQATQDYVIAMGAGVEAMTQLPGLQTYGTQNRVTVEQMRAAIHMLPQPEDAKNPRYAMQKMNTVQNLFDPIKLGAPRMKGSGLWPSWRDNGNLLSGAPPGMRLGQPTTPGATEGGGGGGGTRDPIEGRMSQNPATGALWKRQGFKWIPQNDQAKKESAASAAKRGTSPKVTPPPVTPPAGATPPGTPAEPPPGATPPGVPSPEETP